MSVRLSFSHPSRKRLQAWLDGAAEGQVTAHVEHCDRCAALIEELADDPGQPTLVDDAELGDAIREAFTPPDDLNERVLQKVSERERADREVELLLGIFAIAKDAAELMMPPVPDSEISGTDPRTPAGDPADGSQSRQAIDDSIDDDSTGDEPDVGSGEGS